MDTLLDSRTAVEGVEAEQRKNSESASHISGISQDDRIVKLDTDRIHNASLNAICPAVRT